ncbi:MAG: hypothetical protein OEM40_07975 [Acidimicrobiia bacterium]|nr:hypothetical protein [Acidimicrobiia bacterium]
MRAEIVIKPDPKKVARAMRQVDKKLPRQLGKLHQKFADIPAEEAKRRARGKGSGYVRLARDIKPKRNQNSIAIRFGNLPDSAGWEFGAKQYPQFDPWRGSGDDAGYVIGELRRDRSWMDDFGETLAEEYAEALNDIFPDGG